MARGQIVFPTIYQSVLVIQQLIPVIDGPIWVERLNISNLLNSAHGVAITVSDARQQISVYKNTSDISQIDFSRTLYGIWVGANDFFFRSNIDAAIVAISLSNEINDLIRIGAKKFSFSVNPPFQAYSTEVGTNISDFSSTWTSNYNMNLSISIQTLRNTFPHISFDLLNVYSFIQDILANNTAYDIVNGTIVPLCRNSNSSLLIDEYHFTSRVHQLIADRTPNVLLTSDLQMKTLSI